MNTEHAYIEGFVKRAAEHGFSQQRALELLKEASFGKLLSKIRKASAGTHPAGDFAKNYKRQMNYFSDIMRKNPELRSGADLKGLESLGKEYYGGSNSHKIKEQIRALEDITGRSASHVTGAAGDALEHQSIMQGLKQQALGDINYNGLHRPGGFLRYAAKERHAIDADLAKNEIMKMLAKKR